MFYLQLVLGCLLLAALLAVPAALKHRRVVESERAGWADGRYARVAEPFLKPGESVLSTAIAVLVTTATGERVRIPGTHGMARIGSGIGERLLRAGAVRGGPGSTAALMPQTRGGKLLVLTDRRLMLIQMHAGQERRLLWDLPRAELTGVGASARTGLMARLRLQFADGSSAALLTPSGQSAGRLAAALREAAA